MNDPMQAFEGRDFDFYKEYRPRLNKPQVLDDWGWVPDGFVWEVCYLWDGFQSKFMNSEELRDLYQASRKPIVWASCIGVTKERNYVANAQRSITAT